MLDQPAKPRTSVQGGKTVYGARLGCLMLETRFPRVPGDMGNAETWPFAMQYRVVKGASVARVVEARAEGLLDAFLEAADDLVAAGADGITTTCGFLSLFQAPLAAHCKVPVATSALLQVPLAEALLPPGRRAGVITFSAASLTPAHLEAVGVAADVPITGVDTGGAFERVIMDDAPELDPAAMLADVLDAGDRLVRAHPALGAIVLECANMPPYARALQARLRVPVFDIYTLVTWFHAGLAPREFGAP